MQNRINKKLCHIFLFDKKLQVKKNQVTTAAHEASIGKRFIQIMNIG